MIYISSSELPLDQSEVFVLVERAVMIAIRPAELRQADAEPTELGTAESTGMTTIQTLKQQLAGTLGFVEIDGAVAVTIYP